MENRNLDPDQVQLSSAILLATKMHMDQYDLSGEPYILHCIRVMLKVHTPLQKTIAILHDIVEDTKISLEYLRESGFSNPVVEGVDALTHRFGESYDDYIDRVKLNPDATKVKLSDLEDNINALRLPYFGKYESQRTVKYWRAYQRLNK